MNTSTSTSAATRYFLPEGYVERLGAPQDHDINGSDQWQDEVYSTAHSLAIALGLRTVLDIGCGSGFKLIKYFGGPEFQTMGVDLPPAVERLNARYPEHWWGSLTSSHHIIPDLLICSDVIEHLDDPDQLCATINSMAPQWIVMSTPDRKLMAKYPKWTKPLGPPGNGCHVREWSFDEFHSYMNSHFDVIRHWISNQDQCTQAVIAKLKG